MHHAKEIIHQITALEYKSSPKQSRTENILQYPQNSIQRVTAKYGLA